MCKKIIVLITLFLNLSNAQALNDISRFILNHGASDCNGDGPNCNDLYTRAIELNDDRSPISPEVRF